MPWFAYFEYPYDRAYDIAEFLHDNLARGLCKLQVPAESASRVVCLVPLGLSERTGCASAVRILFIFAC